MLLSYLEKRTQTPSSSPDPFSCYKMQRGLNEKTASVPNFLSQSRGSGHVDGSKFGSNLPVLSVVKSGLNGVESTKSYKVNSRALYR